MGSPLSESILKAWHATTNYLSTNLGTSTRTDTPEDPEELETVMRYTQLCDETLDEFQKGEISILENLTVIKSGDFKGVTIPNESALANILNPDEREHMYPTQKISFPSGNVWES